MEMWKLVDEMKTYEVSNKGNVRKKLKNQKYAEEKKILIKSLFGNIKTINEPLTTISGARVQPSGWKWRTSEKMKI